MKRAAALCAISSVLAFSALPARAADLGGNCCADLEDRIAELESISAHHGNKKMSLTIYGQVDKAYLYESNSVKNSVNQRGLIDNSNSPTMFGMTGVAKLDKNWSSGFKIEIQLDTRTSGQTVVPGSWQAPPTIRTAIGWIEGPVGKATIGHGSVASDGTGQVTVANTAVASRMLSLGPASVIFFGIDTPFVDVRRDMVRYDSPVFGGFFASASLANGDSNNLGTFTGWDNTIRNSWDVALRYAEEFKGPGLRVAAAVSYRDEQQALILPSLLPLRDTVVQGSASVMHIPTGLFVNAAAGRVTGEGEPFVNGKITMWQVQAGWEKNLTKLGTTTLFAEYGQLPLSISKNTPSPTYDTTGTVWGLGAVQAIDALSVDLYASYKHYDSGDVTKTLPSPPCVTGCSSTVLNAANADVFMAGMRVKW